eukprot:359793-Chlamydomonas_euryale.AAC.22
MSVTRRSASARRACFTTPNREPACSRRRCSNSRRSAASPRACASNSDSAAASAPSCAASSDADKSPPPQPGLAAAAAAPGGNSAANARSYAAVAASNARWFSLRMTFCHVLEMAGTSPLLITSTYACAKLASAEPDRYCPWYCFGRARDITSSVSRSKPCAWWWRGEGEGRGQGGGHGQWQGHAMPARWA